MATHTNPEVKHDFVLIFDVEMGNPNGDPDAGNLPRTDPESGLGIVTDVCLKRKIRDYVVLAAGQRIYVEHKGAALNAQHRESYESLGLEGGKTTRAQRDEARDYMTQTFWDIRMFGAVMSMKTYNAGQVRGPVQLTFGRSVDPIFPQDISITRVAITREEELEDKETEMGRKQLIPYGLYVAKGFYSAPLGQQTGVSTEDLELLWKALEGMWEIDRSASRGFMATRGLYVFSHDSRLGNAPAHQLFDLIKVERREDVEVARSFNDYDVFVNDEAVPPGVTLSTLVGAPALA